jgi:hypothetical protein
MRPLKWGVVFGNGFCDLWELMQLRILQRQIGRFLQREWNRKPILRDLALLGVSCSTETL